MQRLRPTRTVATFNERQLLGALAKAAQPVPRSVALKFLAEPRGATHVPSLATQVESALRFSSPTPRSFAEPSALTLASSPGVHKGGLAIFNNDVFALDHFAREVDAAGWSAKGPLVTDAPWFEWQPEAQRYAFHRTGASGRVLDHVLAASDTPVKLFRGTTKYEGQLHGWLARAEAGKALPAGWRTQHEKSLNELLNHAARDLAAAKTNAEQGYATPDDVQSKQQSYSQALGRLEKRTAAARGAVTREGELAFLRDSVSALGVESSFRGLFVSTSRQRAEQFSKGMVVEFEVSPSDLRSELTNGRLYAGLEKIGDDAALELGLFDDGTSHSLARLLARGFTSARAAKSGTLFL